MKQRRDKKNLSQQKPGETGETGDKSVVIPKHELESPLSSPGLGIPIYGEKEAHDRLVELEGPERSPLPELPTYSILRKPVSELP